MKSRSLALHEYIAKFGGTFPCDHPVEGDGSNVHFSTPKNRRAKTRYWRIRCLLCKNARSVANRMTRMEVSAR